MPRLGSVPSALVDQALDRPEQRVQPRIGRRASRARGNARAASRGRSPAPVQEWSLSLSCCLHDLQSCAVISAGHDADRATSKVCEDADPRPMRYDGSCLRNLQVEESRTADTRRIRPLRHCKPGQASQAYRFSSEGSLYGRFDAIAGEVVAEDALGAGIGGMRGQAQLHRWPSPPTPRSAGRAGSFRRRRRRGSSSRATVSMRKWSLIGNFAPTCV